MEARTDKNKQGARGQPCLTSLAGILGLEHSWSKSHDILMFVSKNKSNKEVTSQSSGVFIFLVPNDKVKLVNLTSYDMNIKTRTAQQ